MNVLKEMPTDKRRIFTTNGDNICIEHALYYVRDFLQIRYYVHEDRAPVSFEVVFRAVNIDTHLSQWCILLDKIRTCVTINVYEAKNIRLCFNPNTIKTCSTCRFPLSLRPRQKFRYCKICSCKASKKRTKDASSNIVHNKVSLDFWEEYEKALVA